MNKGDEKMKATLLFPNGREKALTLSYDDGVNTDIRFIELMKKYNVKCTFNINSGLFGPEAEPDKDIFALSEKKAREVYDDELIEVATHGYTHPYFDRQPTAQCMLEILKDRQSLEKLFGRIIRGHAYPYGKYNDEVVEILKSAGIAYARTTTATHDFTIPSDWLRLHPTCHHADTELFSLTDRFIEGEIGNGDGWLFYLWGHTFEFERDENWYIIEEFFEKIAGREDIWYATNIEVYEYVEAYKKLIYSADADMADNPTNTDIWVKINDEKKYIGAGATVKL